MMGKGGEKGLQNAKLSPKSTSVLCGVETRDSSQLRRGMDVFVQALKSLAVKPVYMSGEAGFVCSQNHTENKQRQRTRLTQVASGAKGTDTFQNDSIDRGGSQLWSHVEDYFREVTSEDIQSLFPQTRLNVQQGIIDSCFLTPVVCHCHSQLHGETTTEDAIASIVDKQLVTCFKREPFAADPVSKRKKLLSADPSADANKLCHVCYSRQYEDGNKMLSCGSCNVSVHEKCYGVKSVPKGKWLCSWCFHWSSTSNKVPTKDTMNQGAQLLFPECVLCPVKGGAVKPVLELHPGSLKKQHATKFAHLFCSHWIPETNIDDMKAIRNVEAVREDRWQLLCSVCRVKFGACIQCSYENCVTAFHPLCAREVEFQMEGSSQEGSDDIELRAFCSHHSACNGRTTAGVVVPFLYGRGITEAKSPVCMLDDAAQGDYLTICPNDTREPIDGSCSSNTCQKDSDQPSRVPKGSVDEDKVDREGLNDQSDYPSFSVGFDTISSQFTCFDEAVKNLSLLKHATNRCEKGNQSPNSEIRLAAGSNTSVLQQEDTVDLKEEPRNIENTCMLGVRDLPFVSNINNNSHVTDAAVDSFCEPPSLRSCRFEGSQSCVYPYILKRLQDVNDREAENVKGQQQGFGTGFVDCRELQSSCEHDYCSAPLNESRHNQLDAQWKQLQEARSLGVSNLMPIDDLEEELIGLQNSLIRIAQANYHSCEQLIMKVIMKLPSELHASWEKEEHQVLVNQFLEKAQEEKKQGRKERRRKEAQAVLAAATAAVASSSRVGGSWKDAQGPATVEEKLLSVRGLTTLPFAGNVRNSFISTSSYESTASPSIISSSHVGKPISKPLTVNFTAAQPASSRTALHAGVYPDPAARESPPIKLLPDYMYSKEESKQCDICGFQDDWATNRIVYCQNCGVVVHQDCYGISNIPSGAWYCQPCSDSQRESLECTDGREHGFCVQCALCGQQSGAFKRSSGRQWIHVFCAQWIPELKTGKYQDDCIEGLETILPDRLSSSCSVCHLQQGACLRCNFGHCQGAFHPMCARKAGFYMSVKHNPAGRALYRAYCEKHSPQQRMKAETRKCRPDELSFLRRIRVELERLRLICERISRRERLKRDLLNCKRDTLSFQLAMLPVLMHAPDTLSATAANSDTTSSQICTGHDTHFEEMHHQSKYFLANRDRRLDRKACYSHEEAAEVGECEQSMTYGTVGGPSLHQFELSKQVPANLQGSPSLAGIYGLQQINDIGDRCLKTGYQKRLRIRKAEPLHSEVVMTPSEASVQNQRLPKGYAYVPVVLLSKEKIAPPDSSKDT